jgi:hypothetical protein
MVGRPLGRPDGKPAPGSSRTKEGAADVEEKTVPPGATRIGDDLYKVAKDQVDVYLRHEAAGWEVFAALRPPPQAQGNPVFRYLLERNGTAACRPGAFALRDGNIIYREHCEGTAGLEEACQRVHRVADVYGPKLLRMT